MFNAIAQDSMWTTAVGNEHHTVGGIKMMTTFFRDSSLYNVLFSLIGLGKSFITRVEHTHRTGELLILQDMIREALVFMQKLLDFRLATSRRAAAMSSTTQQSTPFEEVLISRLVGKKQVPLIAAIFELIDH